MKRAAINISLALLLGLSTLVAIVWLFTFSTFRIAYAGGEDGYNIYYVAPEGNCGYASPCYGNVQDAVNAVDGFGEVVKIAVGTYTKTNQYNGHSQVVFISKTLTLRGGYTTTNWTTAYPITQPTVLDAQGLGRVFYIAGQISTTLEGFHITGGHGSTGGGVYITNARAEIKQNTIVSNSAEYGGGIYLNNSASVVMDNIITLNVTDGSWYSGGGGLFLNASPALLSNNSIINNTGHHYGGGLYLQQSNATLQNNTITDNEAAIYYGGGVYMAGSTAALISNTISHNAARWDGGGLFLESSPATLVSNTISLNSAASCGGLRLENSPAIFVDNAITGNADIGLGVFFNSGIKLLNNTIANNGSTGLILYSSNAEVASNSILSNSNSGVIIVGGIVTFTGNLVAFNRGVYGGGISLTSSEGTFTGNQITANAASGTPSGGGGLYVSGSTARFENNAIVSNTSTQLGGGIYLSQNAVILSRNTIMSNSAEWGGGGLYQLQSDDALDSNVIKFNSADTGGGLYLERVSNGVYTNNIIADNHAKASGSALYIYSSTPRFLHATIARNSGGDGTGVFVTNYYPMASNVSFTNTILLSHTVGIYVNSGNTARLESTLWGVGDWANVQDQGGSGNFITGTHNYWGDPQFINPDLKDYHIGINSAALNKGIGTGVNSDIDAQARPHYAGYDLGADEWWPLLAVKSVNPETALAGEIVTYTFALTNSTNTPINVYLTDTLPRELIYLEKLDYTQGSAMYASGDLTWTGIVYSGSPAFITCPVQISSSVPHSTAITNVAGISDTYGLYQTSPTVIWVPPYQVSLPLILKGP